jgi:hypothetical protein
LTDDDEHDSPAAVVTPKRSNLAKVAVQRNASKRSSLLASSLPLRRDDDDERPNYSAESLQELKNSTPSTPRDEGKHNEVDSALALQSDRALDLSSKFGSSLARYDQPLGIPSAAEIAEKKARRARLAMESEEFISLDPDDPGLDEEEDENMTRDERGNLILKPKPLDKWGLSESRLVQDDEDIMENFEEFTEDGRIALSLQAEAEATRRKKQEMSEQIAEAEAHSDSESDDSERERIVAYEAAQTRHGTYARTHGSSVQDDARPRTPPYITPIPTLDSVIERIRKQLSDMQSLHAQGLKDMEAIQRERIHLAEEEVRIQQALKDTAAKFEALRKEQGIASDEQAGDKLKAIAGISEATDSNVEESRIMRQDSDADGHEEDEDEDEDEAAGGFVGLGFGAARHGFGASGLLPMPLKEPETDSNSDED